MNMFDWFKNILGIKSKIKHENLNITCDEIDENGFADTYINGKKTNVQLLMFSKEEVKRLKKIGDKIHSEINSGKIKRE